LKRISLASKPLDLRRQRFARCLSLLIPVYSLLGFPKNLTTFLHQNTERSATIKNDLLFRLIFLVSIHLQRKNTRSTSCYAFFKRWLLPSLPHDCYSKITAFFT